MTAPIRKFFIALWIFIPSSLVFAQIETGELPYSYQLKSDFSDLPVIETPSYDYDKIRKESLTKSPLKNLRYARMIDMGVTLRNEANTRELNKGTLYKLVVYSEGALSLSLVFDSFHVPEGAKLFVYNEKYGHFRGAFTSKNNRSSEVLHVAPVKGEQVIVEYFEPYDAAFEGQLEIRKVGHDFRGIYDILEKNASGFGDACDFDNWDINCPPGAKWQNVKHAVVQVLSGGYQCTGSLVNTVRANGRPYLLTANHCISSQKGAEETVVIFNYESPDCNGKEPENAKSQTMSGANLVATSPGNDQLDFALIELIDTIPVSYKPYFAGWSIDTGNIRRSTTIHHPQGDVKKISIDSNAVISTTYPDTLYDPDSHWRVIDWELGTTQGGSSGGPLFNQNKRIIGDLSGGQANCENPINDYFAKISRSWDDFGQKKYQLKAWLDPDNTGFKGIDGYLPYDSIPSNLKLQYEYPDIRLSWNTLLTANPVQYYRIKKNGKFLDSTRKTFYLDGEVSEDSLYHYEVGAVLTNGDTTGYSEKKYLVPGDPKKLPFMESFQKPDTLPDGWFEHNYSMDTNWSVHQGGYDGYPDEAAEGNYNLLFKGKKGDSSKIISPLINLNDNEYIWLKYFFAIPGNKDLADRLNIYIRYSDTLRWQLVKTYQGPVSFWISDSLYLPGPTSGYRLAFEGVSSNGNGIVIDGIEIFKDTAAFEPPVSFNKQRVCSRETIQFSVDTENVFSSYTWDFGYGASPRYVQGYGSHNIQYIDPGQKTVKLTINGRYRTVRNQMITVDTLPNMPQIKLNEDTLRASSKNDLQWYQGNEAIPGATGETFIPEEVGIYKVKATNKYGCSVFSDTIRVSSLDKISTMAQHSSRLKVYPVPASGRFYFEYLSERSQRAKLLVINALGSVVKEKELDFHTGKNTRAINVPNLAGGIYIISIQPKYGHVANNVLIIK